MKKNLLIIFSFALLIMPHFVQGQEVSKGFLDRLVSGSCLSKGDCSLEDMEQGFVLLTKLLIGAIGALALMYFIWGAIQWLTSYGKSEKVKHGQEIMTHTVVALIIAFISFLLVEFFINDLLLGNKNPLVTSCANTAGGVNCGENKVCAGEFSDDKAIYNGLCILKCDYTNLTEEGTWMCLNPAQAQAYEDTRDDECLNDQICTKVSDTNVNFSTEGGCCVTAAAGPDISFDCASAEDQASCEQQSDGHWYNNDCNNVDMCHSGYHVDWGCCVMDGTEVSCEQQDIMTICDGMFLPEQACPPPYLCTF